MFDRRVERTGVQKESGSRVSLPRSSHPPPSHRRLFVCCHMRCALIPKSERPTWLVAQVGRFVRSLERKAPSGSRLLVLCQSFACWAELLPPHKCICYLELADDSRPSARTHTPTRIPVGRDVPTGNPLSN